MSRGQERTDGLGFWQSGASAKADLQSNAHDRASADKKNNEEDLEHDKGARREGEGEGEGAEAGAGEADRQAGRPPGSQALLLRVKIKLSFHSPFLFPVLSLSVRAQKSVSPINCFCYCT